MTNSCVTKGFYVNAAGQHQSSPGFLTKDSWTDPVIKSTVTWVGYTFFELADGAAEHLKTSTEPAHMASFTPWPADAERSSSVEVHVGRRESAQGETLRRGRPYRPQHQAGLQVGQLRNDQGEFVGSVSKTLSPLME